MRVMRELRKLATIMKGSRTIRQVHANSTVKSALLAFIVSLSVTLMLTCSAFATESSDDNRFLEASNYEAPHSQILSENIMDRDSDTALERGFESVSETVPEDETLLADTGLSTSVDSFDFSQNESSAGFETTASPHQTQETLNQSDYVSVRGYSAFNHFSLAVKAMVAAIGVIGVCVAAYYVYRRYKSSKEDER